MGGGCLWRLWCPWAHVYFMGSQSIALQFTIVIIVTTSAGFHPWSSLTRSGYQQHPWNTSSPNPAFSLALVPMVVSHPLLSSLMALSIIQSYSHSFNYHLLEVSYLLDGVQPAEVMKMKSHLCLCSQCSLCSEKREIRPQALIWLHKISLTSLWLPEKQRNVW